MMRKVIILLAAVLVAFGCAAQTNRLVSDDTAKERFLEQHPHLRNAYYRDSLDDMTVLYIASGAKAVYTIKAQEHTVEL